MSPKEWACGLYLGVNVARKGSRREMKLVDEDEEEMTKDIWMDLDGADELYGNLF